MVDLSRVTSVNSIGRRMMLEGFRRLTSDGHEILLLDPGDALPDPEEDGVEVTVVDELDVR